MMLRHCIVVLVMGFEVNIKKLIPDLLPLSSQCLVSAQQLNGRTSTGADSVDVGRGSGSVTRTVSAPPLLRPAPTRPVGDVLQSKKRPLTVSLPCPPQPGVNPRSVRRDSSALMTSSKCKKKFERFDDILCYDDDDCPNGYGNKTLDGCVRGKCSYNICDFQCKASAAYIPIYAR